MNVPPVRLGLLGCGRAARDLHLPALARVPEVRVVALADPDPERLRVAADRTTGARRETDWRAVLDDPAVEAVAVFLPPVLHADAAIAALDAGRHVLIEKPLALSVDECDRVIARARTSDRITMVGFNLRWHRLVRRARALLAAGEVGAPLLVRSTFTSGVRLGADAPPWRHDRTLGGGVFMEVAVHHFDLWRHLTGAEVVEVSATASGVDEAAAVWARLDDGTLAIGAFSDVTGGRNEVDVWGRRGQLHLSCFRFDGLEVARAGELYPGSVRTRLKRLGRMVREAPTVARVVARGGDYVESYAAEWRAFAGAVRSGRPVGGSLDDGRRAVAIATAAALSAQTGAPVPCPPGAVAA